MGEGRRRGLHPQDPAQSPPTFRTPDPSPGAPAPRTWTTMGQRHVLKAVCTFISSWDGSGKGGHSPCPQGELQLPAAAQGIGGRLEKGLPEDTISTRLGPWVSFLDQVDKSDGGEEGSLHPP